MRPSCSPRTHVGRWGDAGQGRQQPDELRYDIILPDGAALQAFSRRVAGHERRYNTIVLPPRWPVCFFQRPPAQLERQPA